MGSGASKGTRTAGEPFFPLDNRIDRDLDTLSFLAMRILSTPDVYDIKNLEKPGICGDYAVFLKKKLERQILKQTLTAEPKFDHLLPFVADLSGEIVEISYKNPATGLSDSVRRRICSSLADTMLRAIAIVLACLASIQVRSASRDNAVKRGTYTMVGGGGSGSGSSSSSYVQAGGSITEVRDWLSANRYITAATGPVGRQVMDFRVPDVTASRYKYKLTLLRSDGNLSYGLISSDSTGITNPLPSGYINVQFLKPFPLPVPGQVDTVLPMRVYDNSGRTWGAGILYKKVFKPFSQAGQIHITLLFEELFKKAQGVDPTSPLETAEQIKEGYTVFQQMHRTQDPQYLYQALDTFFQTYVAGYQRGFRAPVAPGYGYAAPPYGAPPYGAPPGYGAPGPYGAPVPVYGPYAAPVRPLAPANPNPYGAYGAYGGVPAIRPVGAGSFSYDIPPNAAKSIVNTLKFYQGQIAKESSPVYVRSKTLAGVQDKDRSFITNVCKDEYWSDEVSKIYPWATFQFLSITNWSKIAESRQDSLLDREWLMFVNELKQIYDGNGYPKLDGANWIDQMRFIKTTIQNIPICRNARGDVHVNPQQVYAGLTDLQTIYERHVVKVWAILNQLIMVIKDPDTDQEMVRLHVNVMKGPSQAYVEGLAAEARALLSRFYIDVEKSYKATVQGLV